MKQAWLVIGCIFFFLNDMRAMEGDAEGIFFYEQDSSLSFFDKLEDLVWKADAEELERVLKIHRIGEEQFFVLICNAINNCLLVNKDPLVNTRRNTILKRLFVLSGNPYRIQWDESIVIHFLRTLYSNTLASYPISEVLSAQLQLVMKHWVPKRSKDDEKWYEDLIFWCGNFSKNYQDCDRTQILSHLLDLNALLKDYDIMKKSHERKKERSYTSKHS